MKLFMSGQKFVTQKDTPAVIKIKALLDNVKDGELMRTEQVVAAAHTAFTNLSSRPMLFKSYSAVHRGKKYWGNKKTIAYFKKETAK